MEPTLYVTMSRKLHCMLQCHGIHIVCHNVTKTYIVCHNATEPTLYVSVLEPTLYVTMSRNLMCVSCNLYCQGTFIICQKVTEPNLHSTGPTLYVTNLFCYVTMHWNQICMSQCIETKFVYHNALKPNLYVTMPRNRISISRITQCMSQCHGT